MFHPVERATIKEQVAQCPAAECGDEADDEYANWVKFMLLRADES